MEQARSVPSPLQVVLDTTDARRLAEFYRQLLGFAYRAGDEPREAITNRGASFRPRIGAG